ncbi:MAG: hypothetical protein IPK07_02450 [Deltaproteobacteria bacterium]|nr:hypothetical protein [Deltaproteobacteria bacterium]
MIPGFNQNVRLGGRDYHVQTEDSGLPVQLVTTHIYIGGTIIASKKTSYAALGGAQVVADPRATILRLMEEQHAVMVRHLRSGLYTKGFQPETSPTTAFVLGEDPRGVANAGEIDDCMTDFIADRLDVTD